MLNKDLEKRQKLVKAYKCKGSGNRKIRLPLFFHTVMRYQMMIIRNQMMVIQMPSP